MSHRLWRLAASTLLSIGLLWLAARGVSWSEVAFALGSARWNLIAVAAVCVVLASALRAWCWRRLLVASKVPVTFVRAWKILLIGQFLNRFLTQMCARFSPSRSAVPWEEAADVLVPANQR